MPLKKLLLLIPLIIIWTAASSRAADYFQVAGLIDVRTTFSDGTLDIESLAQLAQARGFDALFLNDHDRMVIEYGLFPFRNILKKQVELNSINKTGAENYLNAINKVREKQPNLILIPGAETTPFYFWQGSYFKKNLTAYDHEKRILTIGLEQPEDYQNLPILHNGLSFRFAKIFLPKIFIFLAAFIIGIILLSDRGIFRISGIVISIVSLLLLINHHPLRSSPFDPYHGPQGIAPYQLLIDDVNSKGGLTFWNYPETRSGNRKLGPIFVNTQPYPEVLEQSINYTGFSALYGDTITITEPGHEWDEVLMAFCSGRRNQPVWAIATADFHKDGESGQKLGDFPTVFLVQHRTQKDILSAMQKGRMYACRGEYPQRIVLDDFSICDGQCKTRAVLGEEIHLKENPKIHIALSLKINSDQKVDIRLIRSGELIKTFSGSLPMEIDFADDYFKPGGKIYYRIDVKGLGTLVSNPIFVSFSE